MPLFGQKTWFRARMNEIKSGIPCSGPASFSGASNDNVEMTDVATRDVLVFWDAMFFCNNFASRPRKPLFPIVRFDIQAAFRARMIIFKSWISWSVCKMITIYKR
jgi:hypothetical protein